MSPPSILLWPENICWPEKKTTHEWYDLLGLRSAECCLVESIESSEGSAKHPLQVLGKVKTYSGEAPHGDGVDTMDEDWFLVWWNISTNVIARISCRNSRRVLLIYFERKSHKCHLPSSFYPLDLYDLVRRNVKSSESRRSSDAIPSSSSHELLDAFSAISHPSTVLPHSSCTTEDEDDPSRNYFLSLLFQLRLRLSAVRKVITLRRERSTVDQFTLYSLLWYIGVDISLGFLFSYILHSNDWTTFVSPFISPFKIHRMRGDLQWLMNFPAKIKLNRPCSLFLGSITLATLDVWEGVVSYCRHLKPFAVQLILILSCFGGISFSLAFVADLINIMTLHLFYMYGISSRLCSMSLRAAHSLFLLFRGKKWNVLRKRVDTSQHAMSHTVMGTLVLTMLIFLFPTIATYYLYFLSLWLWVLGLQTLIRFLLAVVNHFPLYLFLVHFFSVDQLKTQLVWDLSERRLFLRYQTPCSGPLWRCCLRHVKIALAPISPLPLLWSIVRGRVVCIYTGKDSPFASWLDKHADR